MSFDQCNRPGSGAAAIDHRSFLEKLSREVSMPETCGRRPPSPPDDQGDVAIAGSHGADGGWLSTAQAGSGRRAALMVGIEAERHLRFPAS